MTQTPLASHPEELRFLGGSGEDSGILSWLFSTDHKRIGMLYLYSVLTMFGVGVILGLLIRIELIAPGQTIVNAQTYNALFTVHGVVMIFLFIIPGIPGVFGNLFLPIHIGANDVAFPRLNLLSWWLYILGGLLALTSLFSGGGPPDTGWTFYVPFSTQTATNVSMAAFGVFILGFSSILTGLNFITTLHRLRARGITERPEIDRIRLAEIESGELAFPDGPAALYSLFANDGAFDASTGEAEGARGLYVIYVPYATEESLGISAVSSRDRHWLMFPGKPWAHIMIQR